MSTILKWGLITGMVYVAFSLIGNLLGIQQGGNYGLALLSNFLLLLATFFTIYLGVKETRDESAKEYFTMGEGFVAGFKMVLIAAVIAVIFSFIYLQFIDPDFMEKILEQSEEQWDEMGAPEENREMGRKMQSYFTNPFVLSAIVLAQVLFWGAIKSLVAGIILKKNPPVVPMT